MPTTPYQILVELTRGPLVESVHFGALAVVDSRGRLVAGAGDPDCVANMRSSSKPFQTLPLIEQGGAEHFGLTGREIALTCASHAGTDEHVSVLKAMQAKIGVQESDLQCGVHPPADRATDLAMQKRGEAPTPYRHNCSGKHTGMLAQARLAGQPLDNYLDPGCPVQQNILKTFAGMVDLTPEQILIGIDGCSAPTFAAPLRSAALAYARLADPSALPEPRAASLRRIYHAMTTHPDMVAGPGRFDTRLMQATHGKIVSKGGAEGYQSVAVRAGAVSPGSPGLGICVKIADGDREDRARSLVILTVLRRLGVLTPEELEALKIYDTRPIYNWRGLEVGEIRSAFTLEPVLAV